MKKAKNVFIVYNSTLPLIASGDFSIDPNKKSHNSLVAIFTCVIKSVARLIIIQKQFYMLCLKEIQAINDPFNIMLNFKSHLLIAPYN